MFLQNANKCFFVCATNSRNIILLFPKKVISHDPLQKLYANLARTCKNKFYENKIKLDWLTLGLIGIEKEVVLLYMFKKIFQVEN